MTKEQKAWFDSGFAGQIAEKLHPDQLLQDCWGFLLKQVDNGAIKWSTVVENFPSYKAGVLKATKQLKL